MIVGHLRELGEPKKPVKWNAPPLSPWRHWVPFLGKRRSHDQPLRRTDGGRIAFLPTRPPALVALALIVMVGGCTENLVQVEWGVSPMITDGAKAYDGSGKNAYGTSPRLRRMERMHRFVYCGEGQTFNGFANTASMLTKLRPRRTVAIAEDRLRSLEHWDYLCAYDLRRNANHIEQWVRAVHHRRDVDGALYRRWLVSESRNPRLAARTLKAYWCGRNNAVPRIAFLERLKQEATKLYPSAYVSYASTIEEARNTLREFCRPVGNSGDGILWVHSEAREVRWHWDAALFAVPHMHASTW